MTEQHGPEVEPWIVRARLEAEKESSDTAIKTPLYAVRPRRLEWFKESAVWWLAKTEMGQYNVDLLHGKWRLSMPHWVADEHRDFDTLAEAKSAAQADYSRRAWACFEGV